MSEETAVREWNPQIKDLGEKIVALSLLQARELADYLKEEHGIEPAAGGAVMMAGPAAAAEAEPEKDTFDVVIESAGDKKIQVIKVVRAHTTLGLKEAKELVDSAPKAVKESVTKEEAEKVKKELEEAGATVSLK